MPSAKRCNGYHRKGTDDGLQEAEEVSAWGEALCVVVVLLMGMLAMSFGLSTSP